MRVAVATPLDEAVLVCYLDVDRDSFFSIKAATEKNADEKLCMVIDQLRYAFSYDQIRFVIACLIRNVEL